MYKTYTIAQVVATAENGAIGIGVNIPWRCPEDLKFFKETTMGSVCIVGSTTYLSLPPSKLPGRELIVLSRHFTNTVLPPNVQVANSLALALEMAEQTIINRNLENKDTIHIIGGSDIYRQTSNITDVVIKSNIETTVENATHFYKVPEHAILYERQFVLA